MLLTLLCLNQKLSIFSVPSGITTPLSSRKTHRSLLPSIAFVDSTAMLSPTYLSASSAQPSSSQIILRREHS